jgi:tetratricopeptide (TPR) repeat protein
MKSKDPEEITIRAEIMKLSKRLERVQQKYQQAKTADRKKTLALLIEDIKMNIGWHLLDCGDYEKGLAVYQSMSWNIYGKHKYSGISRALIDMEYYNEAKQLLEKGLQRFPKSYVLLMRMGIVYRLQGFHVDALKYFKKALKNCPGQRQALYAKATTLSDLGYYEDSLSIVRKLIKEDPDCGAYLTESGYCTQMIGYPEEAVEYYKKASDCGFLSPTIYGGIASAYMDMGFKHDALETAQKGLKEFPDVPGMYENLGECYWEYGWVDEARSILEEGLKKFPEDEELQEALQRIEDETNDPDKNKKPPLLGILLLLSLILKRIKKKN